MASNEGNAGPGIQGMLNAALAVVMIAGGLFLASRKLTSDRPSNPAGAPTAGMGQQEVESRLWEDPMSAAEKLPPDEQKQRKQTGLGPAYQAIADAAKEPTNTVLVLGVMLPGEPYAEDKEKRIRTRYAVISALGVCGFKPDDSSHLGIAISPWPNQRELEAWMTNQSGADLRIATTNDRALPDFADACLVTNSHVDLRLPFERFQARIYYPQASRSNSFQSVMVLWLDEERFGEEPLARLALLFDRVTHIPNVTTALLGPQTSETLRAMLPGELEGRRPISLSNSNLWSRMTKVFGRMQICLNTASAMDEVLINTHHAVSALDFESQREPVKKVLGTMGFTNVLNFACTDAQLSAEILEELALRGVKPASNPKDYVAVISEWDSFYGRMTAVSFAAEVAHHSSNGPSRLEFRNQLRRDNAQWPSNVLRYVYLRGLDGESADGKAGKSGRSGDERNGKKIPTSVEDIRRFSPDANKAEGAAQFDYLSRLGEMIREKDRELRSQRRGQIKAVGVMGSDVYDTLLVLQALRRQLPEALYFTTELDVRLWNPDELEWSRNLLVASSYGLQLAEALQKDTPPFRDAAQSATYAGTLGILGFKDLAPNATVTPRRFEIARKAAYDLSVADEKPLHPKAPGQLAKKTPPRDLVISLLIAAAALVILLIILSDTVNRLVWRTNEFRVEPLKFCEEDFGGVFGVQRLMQALLEDRWKQDPLANWLKAQIDPRDGATSLADSAGQPDRKTDEVLLKWMHLFNRLLFPHSSGVLPDTACISESGLLSPEHKSIYLEALTAAPRASNQPDTGTAVGLRCAHHTKVHQYRQVADEILDHLTAASLKGLPCELPAEQFDATAAAFCARKASDSLYHLRCRYVTAFRWTMGVGMALLLALMWAAWYNTFGTSQGEPFTFDGISVWPAAFIRYGVVLFCIGMVFEARRGLREIIFNITRRYRLCFTDQPGKLCFTPPQTSAVTGSVDANHLWAEFQKVNSLRHRISRAGLTTLLYLTFGGMLVAISSLPSRPVRGGVMSGIDFAVLILAVLAFLFLTFWMIDATRFCRWFINCLSGAPTRYPQATLEHFARKRAIGQENYGLLDEWIDLNLIADLTERVGRLVYLPFIIFFLMLVARTTLWDRWTWPWALVVIFTGNLVLAGASSFILQRAAAKAREIAAEKLKDKVNDARKSASPTPTAHAAQQGEELLEEIQNLRRGAFVSAWRAPLVGALLVPSTGTVVLQLIAVFFNR